MVMSGLAMLPKVRHMSEITIPATNPTSIEELYLFIPNLLFQRRANQDDYW